MRLNGCTCAVLRSEVGTAYLGCVPSPTRGVAPASRFSNGNTLISDQFNDQVIEVNHYKLMVASYGTINDPRFSPTTAGEINAPYSAYGIGDYTGFVLRAASDRSCGSAQAEASSLAAACGCRRR